MIEQLTIDHTVLDAAREVFETMIFMDIEAAAAENPQLEGSTLLGSITFRGTLEGCLTICLSERLRSHYRREYAWRRQSR